MCNNKLTSQYYSYQITFIICLKRNKFKTTALNIPIVKSVAK